MATNNVLERGLSDKWGRPAVGDALDIRTAAMAIHEGRKREMRL